MALRTQRAVFPLDLRGTQYDGLDAVMRRPSLDAISDISGLYGVNVETMTEEDAARIARVLDHFVGCLVSWDLELEEPDPDNPGQILVIKVPPTKQGIAMLDDYFLLPLVHLWLKFLQGEDVDKSAIPQEPLQEQLELPVTES